MIEDILNKIELHQKRAQAAINEIKEWKSLDSAIFKDFEKVKMIDSFIYRFTKIQDLMGNKLFKLFLDLLGEYEDTMSLLDVLDKLEKFGIIDNSDQWMEYRNLRNILTYEYPDCEEEIIEGIQKAMVAFEEIEKILDTIKNHKALR